MLSLYLSMIMFSRTDFWKNLWVKGYAKFSMLLLYLLSNFTPERFYPGIYDLQGRSIPYYAMDLTI